MSSKLDYSMQILTKAGQTLASVVKVILLSKGASMAGEEGKNRELVIMGNGPSLRSVIDNNRDKLLASDLMAVNFFALSPDFFYLRPRFYVLADKHFFNSLLSDSNVRKLWETIRNVSWDMTLLLPSKFKHLAKPLLMDARCVKTRFFNLTPIEGFSKVNHLFFSAGLGMPRPRNVLIPAIMEAIRLGYKKIYLAGADHTWTKTLSVDDENFVVSIQPHFYEDNEEEHIRVRETYKGLKLHDVLGSMVVAFRSYWEIASYARKKSVEIINVTPESMIDAFPKLKQLP